MKEKASILFQFKTNGYHIILKIDRAVSHFTNAFLLDGKHEYDLNGALKYAERYMRHNRKRFEFNQMIVIT